MLITCSTSYATVQNFLRNTEISIAVHTYAHTCTHTRVHMRTHTHTHMLISRLYKPGVSQHINYLLLN